MEEPISYFYSIIASQNAGATYSESVCQNCNRDCRQHNESGPPKAPASYRVEQSGLSVFISGFTGSTRRSRITEISEYHCEGRQGHQRTNSTACLNHFQLLGFHGIQRHKLDNVTLSQNRNINKPHRRNCTAGSEQLQGESDLVENDGRDWNRE